MDEISAGRSEMTGEAPGGGSLRGQPVPVIAVAGPLFLRQVPALLARLREALTDSPTGNVVCDLTGMTAPDNESLLVVFPTALRLAGGWPRRGLHLAGADDALAGAFRRIRMDRYVCVQPEVPAALAQARAQQVLQYREATLPPHPRSARQARALTRDALGDEHRDVASDALLVVDELATNAVRHVAAEFTVSARLQRHRLVVAVTDPSRAEPVMPAPRAAAEHGRGVQLVTALSREWGVRLVHEGGKTVWAALDTSPDPDAHQGRGD